MDSSVITEAAEENVVGDITGQCKWFNDKLGYGFVTVQSGADKGKDIFVHHSGVKPLNSNYKTLKKGEYINFNVITGENGLQAVNVTGIGGGTLMCDIIPSIKVQHADPSFTMVDYHGGGGGYGMSSMPGMPGMSSMSSMPPYGGRGDGGYGGRGGGGRGRGRNASASAGYTRMYPPPPPPGGNQY